MPQGIRPAAKLRRPARRARKGNRTGEVFALVTEWEDARSLCNDLFYDASPPFSAASKTSISFLALINVVVSSESEMFGSKRVSTP